MKNLILVFVAFAITIGAYAQTGSTNRGTTPQGTNNTQKQNTQSNPQNLNNTQNQNQQNNPQDMNSNQNMQNNPQDRTNTRNQNMQSKPQDMNNAQKQKRQSNPQDMNSTQKQKMDNNRGAKTHADGVVMQNGKMMQVKNGVMTGIDQEMTLSNGTKIMSDGTCIKKDGTKMTMKEGQHMDMSGNMKSNKTTKDNSGSNSTK